MMLFYQNRTCWGLDGNDNPQLQSLCEKARRQLVPLGFPLVTGDNLQTIQYAKFWAQSDSWMCGWYCGDWLRQVLLDDVLSGNSATYQAPSPNQQFTKEFSTSMLQLIQGELGWVPLGIIDCSVDSPAKEAWAQFLLARIS
jgi:hypothetical protein